MQPQSRPFLAQSIHNSQAWRLPGVVGPSLKGKAQHSDGRTQSEKAGRIRRRDVMDSVLVGFGPLSVIIEDVRQRH